MFTVLWSDKLYEKLLSLIECGLPLSSMIPLISSISFFTQPNRHVDHWRIRPNHNCTSEFIGFDPKHSVFYRQLTPWQYTLPNTKSGGRNSVISSKSLFSEMEVLPLDMDAICEFHALFTGWFLRWSIVNHQYQFN